MKLLDTSAWVEYFKGSEKGRKVLKVLEEEEVYTSAITFAEITRWVVDNRGNVDSVLSLIRRNSVIIQLEEPILVESGKIYGQLRKIKKSIGLIDVIIYISALLHGLELVTGDYDFHGLPAVVMI
ncbi:MAG TPA: PIN domain-containing protein [Candidatus Nanoarchaeia archaeon]|nr:PIN domain-containing protein [Candidatus Nanoarchaeia archaeon]